MTVSNPFFREDMMAKLDPDWKYDLMRMQYLLPDGDTVTDEDLARKVSDVKQDLLGIYFDTRTHGAMEQIASYNMGKFDPSYITPRGTVVEMGNIDNRIKYYSDGLEQALIEKEIRERRPIDDFEDGAVIQYDIKFQNWDDAKVYTYAAVKAAGRWYTTGTRAGRGYTWDELLDWIEPKLVGEIFYVTEETQLVWERGQD
jgi:hypothetical protein